MKTKPVNLIIAMLLVLTLFGGAPPRISSAAENTDPNSIAIRNIYYSWAHGYSSIQELVQNDGRSTPVVLIVIGTFESVIETNNGITNFQFKVEEVIAGHCQDEIVVSGTDFPQEDPLPEEGDRELLFLARGIQNNDYSYWWGGPWRRFEIIDNKVYPMPEHIQWVADSVPFNEGMELDKFIGYIETALETTPLEVTYPGAWHSLDPYEMYKDAELIVTGTYEGIIDTVQSYEGAYYTHYNFRVEDVVKEKISIGTIFKRIKAFLTGKTGRNIIIEHIGIPSQSETQVKNDPLPETGEKYLLFLYYGKFSDEYHYYTPGPAAKFKIVDDKAYSMDHFSTEKVPTAIDVPGTDLYQFIQEVEQLSDSSQKTAITFSSTLDRIYSQSSLIVTGKILKVTETGLTKDETDIPGLFFSVDEVLKGEAASEIILADTGKWDNKTGIFEDRFQQGESYLLFISDFVLSDDQYIWIWPSTRSLIYKLVDDKVYSLNYVLEDVNSSQSLDFDGVPLEEFKQMLDEAASD